MTSSSTVRGPHRLRWLLAAGAVVLLLALAAATGLLHASRDGPPPSTAPALVAPSDPPRASTPQVADPAARAVAPMSASAPRRLLIPAIGVDSNLMDLGLAEDGTLETPPGAFPAGWFTGAPTPGQVGPAIIVGHVRYETPGVFARLTELRRGQLIVVDRADGSTARFRVTRSAHFAKSAFPTQTVYGDIDHAGLRLITCGGLDADTDEFDENVVVFARLVAS